MANKVRQFNWPKLGNERVVEFLDQSVASGQISPVYLFIGPSDLGKGTVARALALNLLIKDRPDLNFAVEDDFSSLESDYYVLSREEGKKNISVEQARDFIHSLSLSSFLDSYKIGLVKDADLLSEGAVNALLKTLEEPRGKTVIILFSSVLEAIPKTIVSRSQVLYFYPVPTETIHDYLIETHKVGRSQAKNLAALALGRPLRAVRFLENGEYYEAYLANAKKFLSILGMPLAARWGETKELLESKQSLVEQSSQAAELFDIWQGVLRDLILLHFGQKDLVQFKVFEDELQKVLDTLSVSVNGDHEALSLFLFERSEILKKHQRYLSALVPPRSLIESLAINL